MGTRSAVGRIVMVLSTILAAALAGCTGNGSEGLRDDDAVPLRFKPAVAVSRDLPGAEPVIAVSADGTLFVEGVGGTRAASVPGTSTGSNMNVNQAWRSRNDGASWVRITPPGTGELRSNDGFLAVADDSPRIGTTTLYVSNVFSLTFSLWRSEDDGDTWVHLPGPSFPALMHRHWILPDGPSTLHLAMEALPPSFAPALLGAPQVPVSTLNEGMWYFRSEDRGVTWTPPRQIDARVNFAGQGNLAMGDDGTHLYVLRYEDDKSPEEYRSGRFYLVVSEDGGATWQQRDAFPLTGELSGALPSTAVLPDGTVVAVWSQSWNGTSRLLLRTSHDAGQTWTPPLVVVPAGGSQAMPWIAARGDGSIGVLWYEASHPGQAAELNAEWRVRYALVSGLGGETNGAEEPGMNDGRPSVQTAWASEVVHRGNICAKGPACTGTQDRRLLDYPWIDFGPDGRAHLVFASTVWYRPSAFAVVASQGESDT